MQSSTEQWEMHFALTSAAVHEFGLIAHLHGEQISINVIAVTQACCEHVLQSSTEQWEMQSALTSAAVHECWVAAHLYGEQISIGVIAVTQTAVSLFCGAALNSGKCILP